MLSNPASEPLSRADLLDYWTVVDQRVEWALDSLDLDAVKSGG